MWLIQEDTSSKIYTRKTLFSEISCSVLCSYSYKNNTLKVSGYQAVKFVNFLKSRLILTSFSHILRSDISENKRGFNVKSSTYFHMKTKDIGRFLNPHYCTFKTQINPFVPNAPFLCHLKTLKNLTVFWCFQGIEKGCIGNEWVKIAF